VVSGFGVVKAGVDHGYKIRLVMENGIDFGSGGYGLFDILFLLVFGVGT
jgi:hypothetical protein